MEMTQALVVIDMQKDFCEGGVLAAKNTASLIAPLNATIIWCETHDIVCVFTRDWHPPNHCSFHSQGGPWPVHCVQGSIGAEFASGLYFPSAGLVIDIEKDREVANMSYSAFENTSLERQLRERGIDTIVACGIATDYCVKATVIDALRYGFHVIVLTDLIRPINVSISDDTVALHEMELRGAQLMSHGMWMENKVGLRGRC